MNSKEIEFKNNIKINNNKKKKSGKKNVVNFCYVLLIFKDYNYFFINN